MSNSIMTHIIRHRTTTIAIATAIVVATLCVSAQIAAAASSSCWLPAAGWSCDTGTVSADPVNHFVHIDILPKIHYQVIDRDNSVVVRSGTSGWTGTRQTITGLYGRYYIHAWRTSWLPSAVEWATINNN